MNVVDSLADLIRGNPFETRTGSLILQATPENSGINYDHYLLISEQINNSKDGPKEAFRAIKRRLNNTIQNSPNAALNTLTLFETCLDNCGYRFQILFAERDSIADIVKYSMPSSNYNIPPIVHHKILTLFKKYAEKFKDNIDVQSFPSYFIELQQSGAYTSFDDIDMSSFDMSKVRSNEYDQIKKAILNGPSSLFGPSVHSVGGQRSDLNANYQQRMNWQDPLAITRKENFREMAMSKCELLMGLIEANKNQNLDQIEPDTKNLMLELNGNLDSIQRNLMQSIETLQMTNEEVNATEMARNVNTNMDGELMTLIGLNDEVLQVSNLFKQKFFKEDNFGLMQAQDTSTVIPRPISNFQPKPSGNVDLSTAATTTPATVPGLRDSIDELEEMQKWMNANNKPVESNPPATMPMLTPNIPSYTNKTLPTTVTYGKTSTSSPQHSPVHSMSSDSNSRVSELSNNMGLMRLAGETKKNDENQVSLPPSLQTYNPAPILPIFNSVMPTPISAPNPEDEEETKKKILNEFDPFKG